MLTNYNKASLIAASFGDKIGLFPQEKGRIMKYETALQLWGAEKLSAYNPTLRDEISLPSVSVNFNFNEGYACCGGSDPDCYCSFAESPSAEAQVTGVTTKGHTLYYRMDVEDFDFATVLGELCSLAKGEGITS